MAAAPSVIPGYRRDKDWDGEREMLFPYREGQTHQQANQGTSIKIIISVGWAAITMIFYEYCSVLASGISSRVQSAVW